MADTEIEAFRVELSETKTGSKHDSLDLEVGDDFWLHLEIKPAENGSDCDIDVRIWYDDILVYKKTHENIDLVEDQWYEINISSDDFEEKRRWERGYLAYICGEHEIKVEISGDVEKEHDKVTVEYDGKEFDTFRMEPEEPKVNDEITLYVEDKYGDPLEDAYVCLAKWDEAEEMWDYSHRECDKTDEDGETSFNISEEFEEPYGKYIFYVVEDKYGGDYCRSSIEFEILKYLKIVELPSLIREGETFSLRVVDNNGDPVANARVTISGSQGFKISGATNSDGYISFTINQSGSFSIIATKSGYEDSEVVNFQIMEKRELTLEISPAKKVVNQKIKILVKSENKPVADVNISIREPSGNVKTLKTGSDGKVEYTPKEPGSYEIIAEKETYKLAKQSFFVRNIFKVSIPQNINPGQEITIDVKDANNNPVKDAKVLVNGVQKAVTDERGKATLLFEAPGEYTIGITKTNFEEYSKKINVIGVILIDLSDEVINLTDEISILLKDNLGNPIDATIKIKKPDGSYIEQYGSGYTFRAKMAGIYEVTAEKPSYFSQKRTFEVKPFKVSLKAYVSGSDLIVEVELDGEPLENISIMVTTPNGTIHRIVTNSDGIAKLNLDEINERGNYTITLDERNYVSEVKTLDIESWGGMDLLTILLILLLLIVIAMVAVAIYMYYKTKEIKPETKKKTKGLGKGAKGFKKKKGLTRLERV